ncbi:MAG: DMT family transporter [Variovorax sp.]
MAADVSRLPAAKVLALTALAMLAFAGNSLLCRMALKTTAIDAGTFTTTRLLAGAIALALLVRLRGRGTGMAGEWPAAVALFIYAAAFSYAYFSLPAGVGALMLFGAVQVTMIGYGLWHGERLRPVQMVGLLAACCGLVALLVPGVQAPSWSGSMLMLAAGAAWGVYTLRGRKAASPLAVTAGNFWRAALLTLLLSAVQWRFASFDARGLAYAIASGALTSGVGYAIWYAALPGLQAAHAATVQLTVPVLAALGATALLGESLTPRLTLTSIAVLGGVALVIAGASPRPASPAGPKLF